MTTDHTFEDSIKEMQQCAEAKQAHERYYKGLSTKITYLKNLLSEEQLSNWRMVESIIRRNANDRDDNKNTVMKIYPDDIRKELLR